MIRRSPEIEAIVRRWTDLIRTHRVNEIPHYLSQEDALHYIGTSGEEWWQGRIVRDGIADHLAEVPDFTEEDTEIEAWENGDTGWASYRSLFRFHDTGTEGRHRATFVFVLERGGWKMIQHHISQGDSNIEKMGVEHSAFQTLIEAAQAGGHDFGAEGLATIMFTDVVGSTALNAAMGDRAWFPALDGHIALITRVIEDHNGQLVKSLGDGTMSAFTSARAAISAAHDIQARIAAQTTEPVLTARIGLHTGEVIRSRDDFFGNVVNKAARIAGEAGAGDILVSEATRLIAGDLPEIVYSAAQTVQLKGFDTPDQVYGVSQADDA